MSKHMHREAAESKAKRTSARSSDPWYKRNPQDFHDGTRELSLEARGAYNDVVDMIYIFGGALRMSDTVIASKLVVDVRKWRPLKKQLIASGKLFLTPEGWLHNERAEAELLARQQVNDRRSTGGGSRGHRPDIDRTSTGHPQKKVIEFKGRPAVTPTYLKKEDREEERKRDPVSSVVPVARPAPAAAPRQVDLIDLRNKLTEAANGALASEAVAPGLAILTIPEMWMREGADLELDIIPALQDVGRRKHGANIRSWKYFNGAVADKKAEREGGLPPADPGRSKLTANDIALEKLRKRMLAPLLGAAS